MISAVLITKEREYPLDLKPFHEFFDEVLVKRESPSVYERYELAKYARNETIFVQDDDAIVDFKELFKHYDGRLTNGITEHHTRFYEDTGITLVGWGCFFPKEMLLNMDKYISKYGKDAHLLREADRIFTFLNQPHNSVIMKHTDLPQVGRMSHDPSHFKYILEVLEKLRAL